MNSAMDHSTVSWETIRIDAKIPYSKFRLMVPQNYDKKILILWEKEGSGPTHGLNSLVIDPKNKMTEKEKSIYPAF